MGQADFKLGGGVTTVPYVATTPIAAGDIIPFASNVFIAHAPIANGDLGTVAVANGVYDVDKVSGVNRSFTVGQLAAWDVSVSGAVSVVAGNRLIGRAVSAAGVSDTKVRVMHLQPTA